MGKVSPYFRSPYFQVERFRVLNGLDRGERLKPGSEVKIVVE